MERDGIELASELLLLAGTRRALRGRGPLATLERYGRMHALHSFFDDIVKSILINDNVETSKLPAEVRPLVQWPIKPETELHILVDLRTIYLNHTGDDLIRHMGAKDINLEFLDTTCKSGIMRLTLHGVGRANCILDIEQRLRTRHLHPELDPMVYVSSTPFPRPEIGGTEQIRFYGTNSHPKLYASMREQVMPLVDRISITAEEITSMHHDEECRPWRGTARFKVRDGQSYEEAIAKLTGALTQWGMQFDLTAQRAHWKTIVRPPQA